MKPISYYFQAGPEPVKRDYVVVYAYNQGKVVFQGSDQEWNRQSPEVKTKLVEKVVDNEAYTAAIAAFRQARALRFAQFKIDLAEHVRMVDHPKFEDCFKFAEEQASDRDLKGIERYECVVDVMEDVARLVLP